MPRHWRNSGRSKKMEGSPASSCNFGNFALVGISSSKLIPSASSKVYALTFMTHNELTSTQSCLCTLLILQPANNRIISSMAPHSVCFEWSYYSSEIEVCSFGGAVAGDRPVYSVGAVTGGERMMEKALYNF